MLKRLAVEALTIGELAQPLSMSLAAASKHVQVLEQSGLIQRTVEGRKHVCRLNPAPLAAASEWINFYAHFWNERLDALDAMFAGQQVQCEMSQQDQNRETGDD